MSIGNIIYCLDLLRKDNTMAKRTNTKDK